MRVDGGRSKCVFLLNSRGDRHAGAAISPLDRLTARVYPAKTRSGGKDLPVNQEHERKLRRMANYICSLNNAMLP